MQQMSPGFHYLEIVIQLDFSLGHSARNKVYLFLKTLTQNIQGKISNNVKSKVEGQ